MEIPQLRSRLPSCKMRISKVIMWVLWLMLTRCVVKGNGRPPSSATEEDFNNRAFDNEGNLRSKGHLLNHVKIMPDAPDLGTEGELIENPNLSLFKAYDCSSPIGVQASGFRQDMDVVKRCEVEDGVVTQVPKTYAILQREEHQMRKGYSCQIIRSRRVLFCGNSDHQTEEPELSFMGWPYAIDVDECIRMRETQTIEFRTSKGPVLFPIPFGEETHITYTEVGETTIEESWTGREISCTGETWQDMKPGRWNSGLPGGIIDNAVVAYHVKVIMQEELFASNEEEVESRYDHKILNCKATDLGCKTSSKCYIYKEPHEECNTALVKVVRGLEATDQQGNVVLMSVDNSLVRLVVGYQTTACGRAVYRTNYDKLMLLPWPEDATEVRNKRLKEFRHLNTPEVSMAAYVHVRDSFLFTHTLDLVAKEFHNVMKIDCKRRYKEMKLHFWLQMESPGLTTWFLGEDVFATAAGETLYKYRCKTEIVRAIPSDKCYHGVPVQRIRIPAEGELDVYEGKPLFMEPLTHRLSTYGIPSECSSTFMAKFRNIEGRWVTVSPHVKLTTPPNMAGEMFTPLQKTMWAGKANVTDPDAGLYSWKELQSLHKQQTMGLAAAVVEFTLVNQIGQVRNDYIGPDSLFTLTSPAEKWASHIWQTLMGWLHSWGDVAAVFISLYIIGRLVATIINYLLTCFSFRDSYGTCARQLLWAQCPLLFLIRKYRSQKRREGEPDNAEEGLPLRSDRNIYNRPHVERPHRPPPLPPIPAIRTAATFSKQSSHDLNVLGRLDQTISALWTENNDQPKKKEHIYAKIQKHGGSLELNTRREAHEEDSRYITPIPPAMPVFLHGSSPRFSSRYLTHQRRASEGGYFTIEPKRLSNVTETTSSKEASSEPDNLHGGMYPRVPQPTEEKDS